MLIVKEDGILLDYLYSNLDMPKKKIKSYLTHGSIFVNDKKITQYNYKLTKGMKIKIDTSKNNNYFFDIIYEDNYIIVVNKPSGLLTIGTDKEKNNTLYHYVSEYLKSKNKFNKVFIVHRLDKDTSGVVLLAKDIKTKNMLQNNWNDIVLSREYTAIVYGVPHKKKDRLVNNLLESKTNIVYITKNRGKEAITNYEVLKSNNNYSLLKINIETGRKNQIRCQLSNINNPIVGDKKYGKKDNSKRLLLHANKLVIYYKVLNKEMTFISELPKEFNIL